MTIDEPRAPRSVGVILFDRFELLDVFGPLELFGALPDRFEVLLLGEKAGLVRSAQGPIVVADQSYGDAPRPDVVLVPGGIGTRTLVQDRSFGAWLAAWAIQALALIARLHCEELATAVADRVEYDWHRNPTWDPFAAKNGLVVD